MASSNQEPPPASAASAANDDELTALQFQALEQLVSVYGFSHSAASAAVEAVGTDVSLCCDYILEQGLGQDAGGPVYPIDTCPHIQQKVQLTQVPLAVFTTSCSHAQQAAAASSSSTTKGGAQEKPMGRLKSDQGGGDGSSCPSATENWLCLTCGAVRCSRYVQGHGLVHWQETVDEEKQQEQNQSSAATAMGVGHCVAVSLADLSVWCYVCNAYLKHDTLTPLVQQLERLKFPEEHRATKKPKPSNSDDEKEIKEEAEEAHGSTEANAAISEEKTPGDAAVGNDHDGNSRDEEEDEDDDDDDDEDSDMQSVDLDFANGRNNIMDMIMRAAAARGIPVELLASDPSELLRADEPVEYPFDERPSSLQDVAAFIQSDQCQSILILAGAGMSVASGIPDFRSSDGLYATLRPDSLTATQAERESIRDDPTVALDHTLFVQNPLPCLELKRDFILGTRDQRWKATLAHRFVELLHTKTGKLTRLYTQNIDGLEDQCLQLPRNKTIAVHGSMDRAECALCHEESDFEEFCKSVETQIKDVTGRDESAPAESKPVVCKKCGAAAMKPAIVLFKSNLPRIFFDTMPQDVRQVDLLIVMGTSLRVAPANSLVYRVPRSALRMLVNREPVGLHLGMDFDEETSRRDYFAQGSCDDVLLELMEHLGWLDDLAPLADSTKLPEASRLLLERKLRSTREAPLSSSSSSSAAITSSDTAACAHASSSA